MTTQPEPYTYTDPDGDTLSVHPLSLPVGIVLRINPNGADENVLIPPAEVERVVAAIRAAAGAQQPAPEERHATADEEQRDLLAMLQAERAQADGIIRRLRAELGQARGATGAQQVEPVLDARPGTTDHTRQQQIRVAAHAEGEHAFCGPECRTTVPADGEQETRQQIAEALVRWAEHATTAELRRMAAARPDPSVDPVTGLYVGYRDRAVIAEESLATVLRLVSEVTIEANDVGGVDINDLVDRLGAAGHPLPDDEDDDA